MNPPMNRWVPFAAMALFVGGVIFCADAGLARGLFEWLDRHPGSDKAGHFLLVGGVAWTLNRALRGRMIPLGFASVQAGGLVIAILMTLEEFSQLWIAGRKFDLGDLAANYAGVLVAGWLSPRHSVSERQE